MLKPSNELLAISDAPESAGDSKGSDSSKVVDLLKEFNALMAVRMSFPWVVGGLALWASLNE